MANIFDDLNGPQEQVVNFVSNFLDDGLEKGKETLFSNLDAMAQKGLRRIGLDAAHLSALFSPVAEVKQDPVISYEFSPSGTVSVIGFSLQGKTALTLNVVGNKDNEFYPNFKAEDGRQLVMTEFSGSFEFGASVDQSFKYIRLAVDSGANLGLTARVFTHCSPQLKLGQLLVRQVKESELSLSDLHATATTLSTHYDGFKYAGFSIVHERGFYIDADISVGKSWDLTSNKAEAISVNAQVGLSFTAGYKFTGGCRIVCHPHEAGLQVSIKQARSNTRNLGLSLGLNLEVKGLDVVASKYLSSPIKYADEKAEALNQLLETYKQPGTWLFGEVRERSDELTPDWLKEIVDYVLGGDADLSLKEQITQQLKLQALTIASAQVDPWTQSAEGLTAKLIAGVLDLVGVDATTGAGKKLADKLSKKAAKQVEKTRKKLDEKIAGLVDEADLEALLKPLETARTAVLDIQSRINNADAVTAIRESVREWLNTYQDAMGVVKKALAQSAELQMGLSVFGRTSRSSEQESLLSFVIDASSGEGRTLYHQVLLGLPLSLQRLQQLESGNVISHLSGWLSEKLVTKRTVGFKLSFGDSVGFGGSRTIDSIADAKVDTAGRILVAKSSISQAAMSQTFKETRSVKFVSGYDVVSAIQDGVRPAVGVSLCFEDQDGMRLKELKQFLKPMTKLEPAVLDDKVYEAVVDWYKSRLDEQGASGSDEVQLKNSRIECLLSLTGADYKQLSEEDTRSKIRSLALRKLVDYAFDDTFRDQLDLLSTSGSLESRINKLTEERDVNESRPLGSDASYRAQIITPAKNAINAARDLSQIPDYFRELKNRVQQSQGSAGATDLREDIADFNRNIQEALSQWLKVRGAFSGFFTEKPTGKMLAFLTVLAEVLQRESDQPLLIPVATVQVGDKEEKRIFTPNMFS